MLDLMWKEAKIHEKERSSITLQNFYTGRSLNLVESSVSQGEFSGNERVTPVGFAGVRQIRVIPKRYHL